jgi:hypothetical protein
VQDSSLSERLARTVSADFFRPLTRPSAPVSVDCAQRLIEEAGLAGRLPFNEARQIIREVLVSHPQVALADDEGALLRDVGQRAGMFMNRLLAAGWLEEQTLGLQDRRIIVTPGLRLLMGMLRALAEDEIAELRTFADTLRGVCETLERPQVLDADAQTGDSLRATINDLSQRLDLAVNQLYSVEKLIAGFEAQQRQSDSAAQTLKLFYLDFAQGQHMVCYDVLSKGGLLSRLRSARALVAAQQDDPLVRERLAEGIREHFGYDAPESVLRARQVLATLERSLGGLGDIARAIDERMAAFNRLSQQRYRYQTEVRGRRPELVKAYCEAINAAHNGAHFRDLSNMPADFKPLCPEVKLFFGTGALWKGRNRRPPVDLKFNAGRATPEDEASALEAMRQRQRLALTPMRAARLVSKMLPGKKASAGTDAFRVSSTDELLDLLATVAYDHAQDEQGRMVRWKIASDRQKSGMQPEKVVRDEQLEWKVDRFTLTRTS